MAGKKQGNIIFSRPGKCEGQIANFREMSVKITFVYSQHKFKKISRKLKSIHKKNELPMVAMVWEILLICQGKKWNFVWESFQSVATLIKENTGIMPNHFHETPSLTTYFTFLYNLKFKHKR